MAGRTFSKEFKLDILSIIHREKLPYSKACKRFGVAKETLSRWDKQFGPELCEVESLREITIKVTDDIAVSENGLRKKYYSAKNAAVDRMLVILPETTDLDKLSRALRILCEVDGTMPNNTPGETPGDDNRSPLSYYNEISKYLEKIKYEPKSNIKDAVVVEGDPAQ